LPQLLYLLSYSVGDFGLPILALKGTISNLPLPMPYGKNSKGSHSKEYLGYGRTGRTLTEEYSYFVGYAMSRKNYTIHQYGSKEAAQALGLILGLYSYRWNRQEVQGLAI